MTLTTAATLTTLATRISIALLLPALQQEIYSFVALFILKYIGKHIEKYRKNTLYSTITTHTKRFFNVLEHAKRAAGHSRQAVRISILHNYALLITVSLSPP